MAREALERRLRWSGVIARTWQAHTTRAKAPAYAEHLQNSVFTELDQLEGYTGGMLLQREVDDGVEVVVITFWQSLESIRVFAGGDLESAVVHEKAAALLNDFDRRVKHYEVVLKA